LALEQARRVRESLPGPSEVHVIRTSGDRFQDKPLAEGSNIGFFTKEIEQALLSGTIDVAVHSLKDLPTALAPGLTLGAVLARDESSDVLLARPDSVDPEEDFPLKSGATVGASSMRRQALLKVFRPDLAPAPIRGNVPTRIEKAVRGEYDSIIISRAGLSRLGLDVAPLVAFDLNPHVWVIAPGQGVIAVEAREGDAEVLERLSGLDDQPTRRCVQAERSLLVTFGGGCHAPFGSFAQLGGSASRLFVAAPGADGAFLIKDFGSENIDEAKKAAEEWIRSGCPGDPGEMSDDWLCRPARSWS
jgi:hydroxymethylbilane synthase